MSTKEWEIRNSEGEHEMAPILVTALSLSKSQVAAKEMESTRHLRRRVPAGEREFIWRSNGGRCYLCKTSLPKLSSWHIEHVLAFSEDSGKNDILGNMLPSCACCNLRKNNRKLEEVIQQDVTFDLDTNAAKVAHLNTGARSSILQALEIKHMRDRKTTSNRGEKKSGSTKINTSTCNSPVDQLPAVSDILDEVENRISKSFSGTAVDDSRLQALEIDEAVLAYDLDDHTIGNGSFGQVYLGHLSRFKGVNGDMNVAIKFPSYRLESMKSLVYELEMLNRLRHPHIVEVLGWFTPSEGYSIGVVLEYCAYCLQQPNAQRRVDLVQIMLQICCALSCLHEQECIHRDVKPANILISKLPNAPWNAAVAKLCDFGDSKFVSKCSNEHTIGRGTQAFRAPETRNGTLSPASDVYSLGKTIDEVVRSGHNTALNNDRLTTAALQQLIGDMTAYKAAKRPTIGSVESALIRAGGTRIVIECEHTNTSPVSSLNAPRTANDTEEPSTVFDFQDLSASLPPAKKPVGRPKGSKNAAGDKKPLVSRTSSASNAGNKGGIIEEVCSNSTKNDTPKAAQTDSDVSSCIVFMSALARRRELPKGSRKMRYHRIATCRYLARCDTVEIPEDEACEFKHSKCTDCWKVSTLICK